MEVKTLQDIRLLLEIFHVWYESDSRHFVYHLMYHCQALTVTPSNKSLGRQRGTEQLAQAHIQLQLEGKPDCRYNQSHMYNYLP